MKARQPSRQSSRHVILVARAQTTDAGRFFYAANAARRHPETRPRHGNGISNEMEISGLLTRRREKEGNFVGRREKSNYLIDDTRNSARRKGSFSFLKGSLALFAGGMITRCGNHHHRRRWWRRRRLQHLGEDSTAYRNGTKRGKDIKLNTKGALRSIVFMFYHWRVARGTSARTFNYCKSC